jgi:hypothetical protein
MLKKTKVKIGSMVMLAKGLPDDPMYQTSLWETDLHFLRDPFTLKISDVWIEQKDLCVVVDQDTAGVVILTPRGNVGWIGKERMEIVK